MTDEEIKKLKEEVHTWKEASSTNSYKAFQLQEENKMLSQHILELQNDKDELVDRCKELEAQIEKLKCCENCKHHCFWGNELNCRTLSYDEELECMKTKNKWELND